MPGDLDEVSMAIAELQTDVKHLNKAIESLALAIEKMNDEVGKLRRMANFVQGGWFVLCMLSGVAGFFYEKLL